MWELALGGLVACAASSTARLATGRLAAPIQWTGLALLIGASVFYSAKTVFPGSAALVPVIGTALVIMVAAQGSPTRRNGLLDNPAMRWIGDISYSVYLWHWPIVIALKNRSGGVLGLWDALTAFLLTLILSQLTKVFVEDRFRVGGRASVRTLPVRRIGVFVAIAVAIALPLLASATVLAAIAYDRHRFQTANLDPRDYPGAGILLPGSTAPLPTRPFFPPTHLVGLDIPKVYANECSLPYGASTIRSCPSGTPDSPVTVAVVGDSHAAQWLPAFEVAGAKRGWRILPLTKSSCPLAAIRLTHPDAEACEAWTRNALAILTAHPPAVIVYTLYLDGEIAQLPSDEARMAAVRPMLSRLAGLGARVIVLRDTPHLAADPIAALEADATQPTILPSVPRPDDQDALTRAAADLPGVSVLDLNAFICPNGQCFTAIGNVVVWRDRHHITARYAQTLAPLLAERLAPSVTAGHAGNE